MNGDGLAKEARYGGSSQNAAFILRERLRKRFSGKQRTARAYRHTNDVCPAHLPMSVVYLAFLVEQVRRDSYRQRTNVRSYLTRLRTLRSEEIPSELDTTSAAGASPLTVRYFHKPSLRARFLVLVRVKFLG
jgi:hypothetical protein